MKIIYIIWSIPFILISILMGFIPIPQIVIKNYLTIITTNIAIGIFSINFSFFQYQYNLYKNIVQKVSNVHITLSVITLILTLIPLLFINYSDEFITRISFILTPIIIYMGIWVSILVRREINPKTIINKYSTITNVKNYVTHFSPKIIEHLLQLEQIKLSDERDEPPHEWTLRTTPNSIEDDPFEILLSIGIESIKNTDIATFEKVTISLLNSSKVILEYKIKNKKPEGYEIKSVLNDHCFGMITSLANATLEYDKTGTFSNKYINVSNNYLRKLSLEYFHNSELYHTIILSMRDLSKKLLELKFYDGPLNTISIARQAADMAVHCKDEPDIVFKANATYLVKSIIKELGTKAIEIKESDFLYRCLEAIGWLGCSAVKNDDFDFGLICLQELYQLGREARANNLECFDSHCALLPIDHADERMWWMLSWVASRSDEHKKKWIKSFETAYSRLYGYDTSIILEMRDGKPFFSIKKSDTPHKFSFSTNQIFRMVDYSDKSFIKDLKLY